MLLPTLPFGFCLKYSRALLSARLAITGTSRSLSRVDFGRTNKWQWGFNYIMTKKTIHRASADVGLVFTAYNLRRILNIIEKEALRCFLFGFLMYIVVFWALLEHFWRMQKISFKFRLKNQDP